VIRRFFSGIGFYLRAIVRRFVSEDVFLWCGAIAFKVLVAFLPLTFLAFGIFGIVLRREQIFATISQFVNTFTPEQYGERILATISAFANSGTTVTAIGSVALLIAAISLFTTIRVVIENLFHRIHVRRHPLVGYLVDLRMAVISGLLFLSSFGLTLLFTNVEQSGESFISTLELGGVWLERGWGGIWSFLFYLLPLVISTSLFFLLFYLTPRPRPSLSSALFGASLTALLWEVAKHAFSLYARRFGSPGGLREVGNLGGMGPLGEVFGLVVLLVFWVYYSSFVLVIGGMVASIRDEKLDRFDPERARSQVAERIRQFVRGLTNSKKELESEGAPT
jgi:membrane protein